MTDHDRPLPPYGHSNTARPSELRVIRIGRHLDRGRTPAAHGDRRPRVLTIKIRLSGQVLTTLGSPRRGMGLGAASMIDLPARNLMG
jgi:hypothetical protein